MIPMREGGATELSTADPARPRFCRWLPVAWKSGGPRAHQWDFRAGWAQAAVVLLVVGAVGEAFWRAVGADLTLEFGLTLCLLALAGTVPLVLVQPVPASILVAAAGFLSSALLHVLTVGAAIALLAVLVRVAALWAQALAVPFVVLALVRPNAMTVPLAALAPAAVWAGVAM